MPYQPTTNFKDSNNVDLGKKLVTKDYLLSVYPSLVESIGNSNLTVSPALWSWGYNANGQLGVNDTTDRSTPVTTFGGGTNWKQVACGAGSASFAAAIKADGTLWIWGGAGEGRLGTNDITPARPTPVTTFAGGTNWKIVSAGGNTNGIGAIKTDGTLWLWGRNLEGQLGDNTTVNRSTPVTTFAGGTNWKTLGVGNGFVAAIKTDGTLWTWGRNDYGQLGDNTLVDRSTPVTTFAGGTNWEFAATGETTTAAIKTDGTLWIWGRGGYGRNGNNTTANRTTPVTTFAGGTNWKSISLGQGHAIAIKTDGTLWTWGRNDLGQPGVNTDTANKLTPVTTFAGGTNWKSVFCGYHTSSAIKTDGTLWIWGNNAYANLGNNNATGAISTPITTFAGGNDWKSASIGKRTSYGIDSVDYI